jgi:histidinol-phosphatase (PHP family)
MQLHDQHLHSRHSMDCQADPDENCERAVTRGLSGLTFTEHFDPHPTEWEWCKWDYTAVSETIARLREKFAGRLRIGMGIEVCYQPEQMARTFDALESRKFDFVLLSVHWWDGRALHVREHWDGVDWRQATRGYLEAVLSAMRFCLELKEKGRRPFDVLGHMDLVKRYTNRYFGLYDVRQHVDVVDEIWRTALAAGVLPEINTSSWRTELAEPMPADWAIRRYAELGGRMMSIGSDSHKSEHVGADFDRAVAVLREAGIESETVFLDRQSEQIPLR